MAGNSSLGKDGVHTVYVIDDHPLVRVGMTKIIATAPDLELAGETGEGNGLVDILSRVNPDIVVLDLSLKDRSGLELIKDFRAADLEFPILVVSMHDEALYADRMLKAGANGYLMKEEATEKVLEGLRTLLNGDMFLSDKMKEALVRRMLGRDESQNGNQSFHNLTDREFEVFELIGKGLFPRDIAANLGISPKTVDAHRANIKEKLGLKSGPELLRYAVRWAESGSTGK